MTRNEKTRALFLSVLMVLSVFGGAIAFAGTAAADSGSDDGLVAQSNHNTDANYSLDNPDIEVIRGNLARFEVSFNDTNASEAYLTIGDVTDDPQTSYGYEANITIRDDPNSASESGTVVFNTYEAGGVTGNAPVAVGEGGIEVVNVEERGSTSGAIQPTTDADGNQLRAPYPVRFGTVSVDQAYTSPNTTGGMDLLSRDGVEPTVQTWTGPASEVDDLETGSGADIADMAGDTLTPTDQVPSGGVAKDDQLVGSWDALVYQVEAPGIQGFLETRQGTTEDAMISAGALELTQKNPFFNQPPKELDLTYNASGISVKHIEGTDTYFIVANADELNLSRDTNRGRISFGPPQVGETYEVDFSINDQIGTLSASDEPTEFIDADFTLSPSNINNDGQFEIRIQNEFDVSGSSELAPGTEFNVRITNKPGATSTFVFEDNTTVDANGDFSAEYAPQDVPASGTEFDLEITAPAHPTAPGIREDGLFREQPTANVTFQNQTRIGGDLVVIESGDLSDGGFIAIHNESGDIIGSSKLLPPGSYSNLPIALDSNKTLTENATLVAMPHFDQPSDGFFRFNATTGNDSFYYLTQPVDPGDLPTEENRTPVTDSADITYIPQEQQEVTRTVIRTVTVPVDVTRTVTVPVTRTVEVTREVTRTVEVIQTVAVTRTITVDSPTPREITRTITADSPTPGEVTRTITITQTPGQPGFGALVAVIALLAAGLLAARRRDQ